MDEGGGLTMTQKRRYIGRWGQSVLGVETCKVILGIVMREVVNVGKEDAETIKKLILQQEHSLLQEHFLGLAETIGGSLEKNPSGDLALWTRVREQIAAAPGPEHSQLIKLVDEQVRRTGEANKRIILTNQRGEVSLDLANIEDAAVITQIYNIVRQKVDWEEKIE